MSYVIYPEKIHLVDQSRIQDGTVATLDAFASDTTSYLVPRRSEDGATVSFGGDSVDIKEYADNGLLVMADKLRKSLDVSLKINVGRWTFELEALMRGQKTSDVKDDQTASISGADDATAITGIDFLTSIDTNKYALLLQMPKQADGAHMWYYIPKAVADVTDRDQTLNTDQQISVLSFVALTLQTDELSAHKTIYDDVDAHSLIFPIQGKKDTP